MFKIDFLKNYQLRNFLDQLLLMKTPCNSNTVGSNKFNILKLPGYRRLHGFIYSLE